MAAVEGGMHAFCGVKTLPNLLPSIVFVSQNVTKDLWIRSTIVYRENQS